MNKAAGKPQRPRWVSDIMWKQCQLLEATFDSFERLTRSLVNCPQQWQVFFEDPDPYNLLKSTFDVDPLIEGGYMYMYIQLVP